MQINCLYARAKSGKPPGLNEKELEDRMNRVKAAYGADKEDFATFPKFTYKGVYTRSLSYGRF